MISFGRHQVWILLLATALGCSEAEEMFQDVPRVITGKEILTSNSGAIFDARVVTTGGGPVISYGFQWHIVGNSAIDFVTLERLDADRFKIEVNQGFESEARYEVRAFIKTETLTAFGDWVEFSGAGSFSPVITSMEPVLATWSDTITLKGNYFSFNRDVVKVEFGDVAATLLSTTDSAISVMVPINLVALANSPVRVKIGSKYGTAKNLFTLIPSEVSEITPDQGRSGTIVTIKGKYFNTEYSRVKIGELFVPIELAFKDSLKVKLPKEVPAGEQNITVISGPFSVIKEKIFKRTYPIVTEVVPSRAFFGDTITLRGENFGSQFQDNHVVTGDLNATIIDSKEGELKVILPIQATREISFAIKADYVSALADKKLTIKNPLITEVITPSSIYPGQTITINGKYFYPCSICYGSNSYYKVRIGDAYPIVKSATSTKLLVEFPFTNINSPQVELVYYDTIKTISSTTVNTPAIVSEKFVGSQRVKSASFTIGSKAYVLTGMVGGTVSDNTVYEFDASNNNWKALSNFPGEARYGATAFALNNKGYLLGGYKSSGSGLRDLWEYNPATDTWTKKNDYLFHPMEAFNLNGEIYSISDIRYTITPPNTEIDGFGYYTGIWKYDPVADAWTEKAMHPYVLQRNDYYDYFTLQVNGALMTGYRTAEGYLYNKYDPQSNQWIAKGLVDLDLGSPITFEYGGNGYLLTNTHLYKYNINANTWQLLEDNLSSFLWQGGEATKFMVSNKWYFSLFNYNSRFLYEPLLTYANMMIEFDPLLAGF